MTTINETLKNRATTIVCGHGAFGESERYPAVDSDRLIAETVVEVISVLEQTSDPGSMFYITRENAIKAVRDHFGK